MPERPDELEPLAALAPLVDERDREQQARIEVAAGSRHRHARAPRVAGGDASVRRGRGGRCVSGDEPEQPVEERGRGVVQLAEPSRVQLAPPGQQPSSVRNGRRAPTNIATPSPSGTPWSRDAPPRSAVSAERIAPRRSTRRGAGASRCATSASTSRRPCRGRRRARWRGRCVRGQAPRRAARRSGGGRRPTRGPGWRRGRRGAPVGPVRRVATSRSSERRANRRWPPGVVNASTRPSSAQRRSVSGSTPRSRLARPAPGARAGAARRGAGSRHASSVGPSSGRYMGQKSG